MAAFQQGSVNGYILLIDELVNFATAEHVSAAVVNAGGTGYVVGDILTAVGGTFHVAATFEVLTVGGGGDVLTVKIRQSGGYTVNPGNPVSTSGGTGTGCTLDLTFTPTGWSLNRDETGNHQTGEKEVQLEGTGSGADQIFVGIRSYNSGTARNWELAGFTGFDMGLSWENQAGKTPGRFDDNNGAIVVPLIDGTTINYWFNVNPRRIIGAARIGTAYLSWHLGFINPYGTEVEFPYPLFIMGCTGYPPQLHNGTQIHLSSIIDPIRHDDGGSTREPGFFRLATGVWQGIVNSGVNSPTLPTTRFGVGSSGITPAGSPPSPSGDNNWYRTVENMQDAIPETGIPGTVQHTFLPTPDSGGDIFQLWPCALYNNAIGLLGEIDDVYWISATGTVLPEDTINQDFTVFQAGNRSEAWAHFAMRTSE